MSSANRMRTTDNGLSNSSGAPRANHDLVFGNVRLRTEAWEGRAALVTELGRAAVWEDQPRQVVPRSDAVLTAALSAAARSRVNGRSGASTSRAPRRASGLGGRWPQQPSASASRRRQEALQVLGRNAPGRARRVDRLAMARRWHRGINRVVAGRHGSTLVALAHLGRYHRVR